MSIGIKQHLNSIFGPLNESLLAVIQLVPIQPTMRSRDDHGFLCLTTKRNGKNKLVKVKFTNGSCSISKSWVLTDLQIVEVLDRTTFVTVFNKPQQWSTTDSHTKDEFLTTLLKLAKKKPPRLINVDASLMKASNYDLFDDGNHRNGDITADSVGGKGAGKKEDEWLIAQVAELVNIEDLLKDLNWKSNKSAAALEKKLQQDLTHIEMENIHALIESTQRTHVIAAQIDKAVQKLDTMTAWVTSYSSTLAEIAPQVQFIQDQNRRSHTHSRNQALLKETLTEFLSSLTVPPEYEYILRSEPLDQTTVVAVEQAAQALLIAQNTQLDPDLRHLAVVREQTDLLRDLTSTFAIRLVNHILSILTQECEVMRGDRARLLRCRTQMCLSDQIERELAIIPFRSLILWLKKAETKAFQDVITGYIQQVSPLFRLELNEVLEGIKGTIKGTLGINENKSPVDKASSTTTTGMSGLDTDDHGSHADYLFTAPLSVAAQVADKVTTGLSKAGSKATLSALRKSNDNKKLGRGKFKDSSSNVTAERGAPTEFGTAFAIGLQNIVKATQREQNFFVGIFHFYSDVPKYEDLRQLPFNPKQWREQLPHYSIDNKTMEVVKDVLGNLFDGLTRDLGSIIDMGMARDSGSAIVMLNVVEKQMAMVRGDLRSNNELIGNLDVSQLFIYGVLAGMQAKLRAAWAKVMDQQLRAIHESKLTKKKSGILSFVRTCPRFIEHLYEEVESPLDPVRSLLENALEAVLKLVIQSITSIPVVDDEVLILENTLYLATELRSGQACSSIGILTDHIDRLNSLSTKYIDEYVDYLLHKSLGKFITFIIGMETLLLSQTPEEVAFHQAYAKSVAKKVISTMSTKDMIKTCEYVHKKINKSFTEMIVMEQVWLSARSELERIPERATVVLKQVYKNDVQLEFTYTDVRNACATLE